MRRLARHVFTILSAASLVLWVAAVGLWVRSAGHYDRLDYTWVSDPPTSRKTYVATINAGECTAGCVAFHLKQVPANPLGGGWAFQSAPRSTSPALMWPPYRDSVFSTEFGFSRRPWTGTYVIGLPAAFTDWSIAFPVWVAVVLFAVMPAAWIVTYWRRRRARRGGLCPH
jgi:hypothetical protein